MMKVVVDDEGAPADPVDNTGNGHQGKIRQMGTQIQPHASTVNLAAGAADVLMGRQAYDNPYFSDFTGTTRHQNVAVVAAPRMTATRSSSTSPPARGRGHGYGVNESVTRTRRSRRRAVADRVAR
jgi:hypothetical protein